MAVATSAHKAATLDDVEDDPGDEEQEECNWRARWQNEVNTIAAEILSRGRSVFQNTGRQPVWSHGAAV